ncbi:hypothetical protein CJ030_MR7G014404 [Morella rubra]|uniref:Protein kinase domain-containing protein n=1 Tax=Morella rubra TaxID=262757 RepID=A0A6A1V0S3_9ROSI|nr:hypothetical protein CJ030_MR7G014404 [Morella rubra]
MARAVPFTAGLTVLFVLVLVHQSCSAKDGQRCAPSSCGNLNISYPFRLKDDPDPECGDHRYNLSCENNQAVLYLYVGKYFVREINYTGYKIRLVDSGIQEDNHSFIPRYFLNRPSFRWIYPLYSRSYPSIKTGGQCDSGFWTLDLPDVRSLGLFFLSCETQVNSEYYLDTSSCLKKGSESSPNSSLSHSKGYTYVTVGYNSLAELEVLCRIEQMSLTSWQLPAGEYYPTTCTDVYNEVTYGFELSWFQVYCDNFTDDGYCYLNDTSNLPVQCDNYSVPQFRWLFGDGRFTAPYFRHIGNRPLLELLLIIIVDIGQFVAPKLILGTPFVVWFLIYTWRRRHLSMYDAVEEFLQSHNNLMPIRYSYSEIKKMTKRFKDKLGEGGYGTVFKGKLRSGRLVAIKMLDKSKANGQDFMNEVATIGRIHHVNVVQLIGFCVEGSKRALVYEFMPKGSLNKFVCSEGSVLLSYEIMHDIALGVACGIEYLHRGCEMQILHFDIKPHNILLDDNFAPKVSDFGLAKLYSVDDDIVSMTAARGTLGYMAPELFYKNIGDVSYKADVYSFGMLLMEMLGKRNNLNASVDHSSQTYFPTWVYNQIEEGKHIEIEDATEAEKKISKKIIIVALWCIQMKPNDRPSMNEVVKMLEGEVECLQMPPKPFLSALDEGQMEDIGHNISQTCSSIQSDDSSQSIES